eukprot:comp58222_c0_seq1/m.47823 comp58222_c0_seq1/g.47823  ORF comp58222_c0_seq1/g.47823 comp58222_c0_seq1/m.47823 type:complete len:129 (-) comp58222_c0_seq1:678-1064(-)
MSTDEVSASRKVPADKVQLRLLLASGKRADFLFDPTETFGNVKAYVLANWPEEWAGEKPGNEASIRIIHNGRFQSDDSTLESAKAPAGATTTMHLHVVAQGQGEGPKEGIDEGTAAKASRGAKCCNIL